MIKKNGHRLKRTLNAFLDLSMLRSGGKELDRTSVPIDECVRQVASKLRAEAEEKGLSFRVDAPDTPVYAEVDEQYLEKIMRNLVENAIKYTDEGHVSVSSGYSNGHAYVEMEDTGIGIDEDFLPDLFDEFKQESRGRARAYEGNGLGLAISADLADRMDGTIDVETEKTRELPSRPNFLVPQSHLRRRLLRRQPRHNETIERRLPSVQTIEHPAELKALHDAPHEMRSPTGPPLEDCRSRSTP